MPHMYVTVHENIIQEFLFQVREDILSKTKLSNIYPTNDIRCTSIFCLRVCGDGVYVFVGDTLCRL